MTDDGVFPDFPVGEYKLQFRFFENSNELGSAQFVVETMQRRRPSQRIKPT